MVEEIIRHIEASIFAVLSAQYTRISTLDD